MSDAGHSISIARLYEHVSEGGEHYLTGHLGLARVVIVKSDEKAKDGSVIWNVLVQEDQAAQADASKRVWHRPDAPDHVLPDPL